uniref:TBC1 domain family member 1 n=1 Tax=Molossus molossus TaxID=27622 RepID=A0A7J8K173_MOLMO|nr:TBC1 domain family member 1 [Molossus molossus]
MEQWPESSLNHTARRESPGGRFLERLNSSKTKLELQKHLTTLTNQEQAMIFEEVQKLRPRNEQRENELVISFLRCLYEEKQKVHIHIGEIKQTTQIAAETLGSELPSTATRFKLDMLKNKAKRSLTESLESILSRGNKARGLPEHSASLDLDSSVSSTLSNINKEPPVCDKQAVPVSESGVGCLSSSDDLSSDSESRASEEPALLSPQQGFRRRANTLSHFPVEGQQPAEPALGSPGVSQRKLMRDFESKANHLGDTGGTPVKTRRHSWRQQIFLRVATPQKGCDSPSRFEDYSELGELPPRSPLEPVCEDGPFGPVPEEKKRTSRELRELWQKAILQQILLLRMEKENQKLQGWFADFEMEQVR